MLNGNSRSKKMPSAGLRVVQVLAVASPLPQLSTSNLHVNIMKANSYIKLTVSNMNYCKTFTYMNSVNCHATYEIDTTVNSHFIDEVTETQRG